MKPLFILMALMISQAQVVLADSFSIVKDGKNYLCTSAESRNPGSGAECASEAYAGPFSKDESLSLCRDNGSLANADCALKAYAGPYSKAEALRLCKNEPQLMMRSLNLMQQSPEIQQKIMLMKMNIPALAR